MVSIIKFQAGWNPISNRGQIKIRSFAGQNKKLNFENPAEFGAVLQVPSTDTVTVDQSGHSGLELKV